MGKGKDLLESMKSLDMLIKSVALQIELEESRLTDIAIHYKEIQIQSGHCSNALEEHCPDIVELMIKLDKYKDQLIEKKKKAFNYIQKLSPKYQAVLMYYYMQNKTLEQTAEDMDRSYTWTINILREAETEFEKIF